MAEFDPRDPNSVTKKDNSLFWILLPVAIVFFLMMATNMWHIAHQDFTRFSTQTGEKNVRPATPP